MRKPVLLRILGLLAVPPLILITVIVAPIVAIAGDRQ